MTKTDVSDVDLGGATPAIEAACAPRKPLTKPELARLRSLYSLDLLGHDGSRFDQFTSLACHALGVPVALVTLMDDDYQWFCASEGTDLDGNHRDGSFCTVLVEDALPVLIVEDTHDDPHFRSLPIVTDAPFIRFYAGAPLRTSDGHRVGTLCVLDVQPQSMSDDKTRVLREVADLVERELEHVALAVTDELTGLANRRAFLATATQFAKLGAKRDEPVSVVFIDVDGLKTVNDTHGHLSGDALLRRAASALAAAARPSDLVARIGGDEFAICLFGVEDTNVAALLSSIDAQVAASNDAATDGLTLSLSIGASRLREEDSIDQVLDRADHQMYLAKRSRADRRPNQNTHHIDLRMTTART